MVIYWQLPIDGQGKIGLHCKLLEEEILGDVDRPIVFVSPHFCVLCPYREHCKSPLFFSNKIKKKEDVKRSIYELLKEGKR